MRRAESADAVAAAAANRARVVYNECSQAREQGRVYETPHLARQFEEAADEAIALSRAAHTERARIGRSR